MTRTEAVVLVHVLWVWWIARHWLLDGHPVAVSLTVGAAGFTGLMGARLIAEWTRRQRS